VNTSSLLLALEPPLDRSVRSLYCRTADPVTFAMRIPFQCPVASFDGRTIVAMKAPVIEPSSRAIRLLQSGAVVPVHESIDVPSLPTTRVDACWAIQAVTLTIDPPELRTIQVLYRGAVRAVSHTIAEPRLVTVCEFDCWAVEPMQSAFVVEPMHVSIALALSHEPTITDLNGEVRPCKQG
jgi:hypothetical protein